MEKTDLTQLLAGLIATWENEVVEFKQANDSFSTDDIGKYFSVLANEANLRRADFGWLVFGVNNQGRSVVGTTYRQEAGRLHQLKMQITQNTDPRLTFRDIHELQHTDGRVLLFQIPAAPRGIAISWKAHYYARAGESLVSLGLDKLDEIRKQTLTLDWTAQLVPAAALDNLDEAAVRKVRDSFAQKHANSFAPEDEAKWPLETFLDRARVTRDGQIIRTTSLLLGKAESTHRLSPHPVWKAAE
jgi:ATP-dependent DNA helicase RecG